MTLRKDVDVQQNASCYSPYNNDNVGSPMHIFLNIATFPVFTIYHRNTR